MIQTDGLLIWDDPEGPQVVGLTGGPDNGSIPVQDLVLQQELAKIYAEHGSVPVRITIEVL